MLHLRKVVQSAFLLLTLTLLLLSSYPKISADGVDGLLVTSFSLNNSGSRVTVTPGSTVSVSMNYQVWSTQNPIETNQVIIYYSWNPVPPSTYYCAYNAQPGPSPGYSGTASFSFTAPNTPGTYSVYVAKGSSFFCDEAAAGTRNYGLNGFIIGSITVSSTQTTTITSTVTRPTTVTSTQTVTQTITSNVGQPSTVTTTVTSATTITSTQTTTQTVTTNIAQPVTITSTRTVTTNLGNNTVTITLTKTNPAPAATPITITSTITSIQPTIYITTLTATKTDVSTATATSTLTRSTTLTSTTTATSLEQTTEPLVYAGAAGATLAAAILVVALLRRKTS